MGTAVDRKKSGKYKTYPPHQALYYVDVVLNAGNDEEN